MLVACKVASATDDTNSDLRVTGLPNLVIVCLRGEFTIRQAIDARLRRDVNAP
jgi:hypothetical protein